MEIRLKTLTPIHIGNGEELTNIDYAVVDNKFYIIPIPRFSNWLLDAEKEDVLDQFVEWSEEKVREIENLESGRRSAKAKKNIKEQRDYNQKLIKIRKSYNLQTFVRGVHLEREWKKWLKQEIKAIDIGKPHELERGRRNVRNHIRKGVGVPFIPGTSIKGSIRTALLFNVLENNLSSEQLEAIVEDAFDRAKKAIEKANDKRKTKDFWQKRLDDTLQHKVFYCPYFDGKKHKEITGEERFDILKFLLVSDARIQNENLTLGTVELIDIYLVEKIKENWIANRQRQGIPAVTIPFNEQCHFSLDFNISAIYEIYKKLNENGEVKGKEGDRNWKELVTKIKQVYDLDITKLSAENLERERVRVVKHVWKCCETFFMEVIKKEQLWMKNFIDHDEKKSFEAAIKTGFGIYNQELDQPFRVGYGSGFNTITEWIHLSKHHPDLMKKIMEYFNIGDKPGASRRHSKGDTYIANVNRFPKSRRLATLPDGIYPLGWLAASAAPRAEENFVEAIEPISKEHLKRGASLAGRVIDNKNGIVEFELSVIEHPIRASVRYRASFLFPIDALFQLEIQKVIKKGQDIEVVLSAPNPKKRIE